MWDIEKFRPAFAESRSVADNLREAVSRNELLDSRLPNFVLLSALSGQACLPFREHNVETFAPYIYQALRKYGEERIVIFQNPLYDDSSNYIAEVELDDQSIVSLLNEDLFSGGFIIGTISRRFIWIGNFTDYGFMFTDAKVIETIFLEPALTVYMASSRGFRIGEGGDSLLDPEIRKLDELWLPTQ